MQHKALLLVSLFLFPIIVKSQDTIPFSLGDDNRIYIKAIVNNSKPLNFIFDTGADAMVANTVQTDSKLNLIYDEETENTGANGVSTQKVSSKNTIQIGKFKKKNQQLLGIAYPKKYYSFDGVIGYPFFENHLIEIDYKEQKMILHESLKTVSNLKKYDKLKMKMIGQVPFVDFTIMKGNKPITFPAMIDTGFNGSLIVYHKVVSEKGLADYFQKIRSTYSQGTDGSRMKSDLVIVPKAGIGQKSLENVDANLNRTPSTVFFPAIMGGNILKKLHWIIDFRKNNVYITES